MEWISSPDRWESNDRPEVPSWVGFPEHGQQLVRASDSEAGPLTGRRTEKLTVSTFSKKAWRLIETKWANRLISSLRRTLSRVAGAYRITPYFSN